MSAPANHLGGRTRSEGKLLPGQKVVVVEDLISTVAVFWRS